MADLLDITDGMEEPNGAPPVTKECPYCGSHGPHKVRLRTGGLHYADVICRDCRRHAGFLKKPDSDRRRSSPHAKLVKKFSRGFCEMCLVRQEDLPRGDTLTAHHVIEYQHGGEATRENTWILCTACHSLVCWRRTYMGHIYSLVTKPESMQ